MSGAGEQGRSWGGGEGGDGPVDDPADPAARRDAADTPTTELPGAALPTSVPAPPPSAPVTPPPPLPNPTRPVDVPAGAASPFAPGGTAPGVPPTAVDTSAAGRVADPAPSPWVPPSPVPPASAQPTAPIPPVRPTVAPPGPTRPSGSSMAAGPWATPAAPPPLRGMPSAPPQYDPRQYPSGFGAAGGVPTGSVPVLPSPGPSEPLSVPRGARAGTVVLVAVLSAVLASLITGGLFVAFGRDGQPAATATTSSLPPRPPGTGGPGLDIHALLDRAQPSVVSIRTGEATTRGVYDGAGSGVIISDDGYILTNAHVISGAREITVIMSDGGDETATLVGSFPDDDIALVKVDQPDGPLVPAELGSSVDLAVGDPVIAIGNALNLGGEPSVTEGIVSAKNRNIQTRNTTLRNLIQTDAAINPGNSGGPLLDASGRVVGINTAIISEAQNIGFAISIDEVKPLIEQLKNGGGDITLDTAYLGVSTSAIDDVTPSVLEQYGVTRSDGAFVLDVVAESAAEEGGLRPGDVVTSIDGDEITGPDDVGEAIRSHKPGDTVTIEVEREGATEELTVTLKSRRDTGR